MDEVKNKYGIEISESAKSLIDTIEETQQQYEGSVITDVIKDNNLLYEDDMPTSQDIHATYWKTVYKAIEDLKKKQHIEVIDEVSMLTQIGKYPKRVQDIFNAGGGYETIKRFSDIAHKDNFKSDVYSLKRNNVLIELLNMGYAPELIEHFLHSDDSIDDIYSIIERRTNDLFIRVSAGEKAYDITDGIDELVDELDAGDIVGIPFNDCPMLSDETNGMALGTITLLGSLSNVGKSTLLRMLMIPSLIERKEKCVIIINEDSVKKYQRELLVYICNNILKEDSDTYGVSIQKKTLRNGNFNGMTKEILLRAVKYLKETAKGMIKLVPLQHYKTDTAIKIIRKYSSLGYRFFALDTFKADAGTNNDSTWFAMQQSMVEIFDTIKPEALNVAIIITFQLAKQQTVRRYYSQDSIGMSKNIVDVADTCIMMRTVFADEYPEMKRAIKVYEPNPQGLLKNQIELDPNKRYMIFFVVKTREGTSGMHQIVAEVDLSRNTIHEIGITNIMPDF